MKTYPKYKDSNIPWIGRIPGHWNILKTLYVLLMPITDGPHTTPVHQETGIPFISAEAISCGNGSIDFSHIWGYISQEFYDECCKKYKPEINDIYMIKSGATTGKVAIVDTNLKFNIWSPLAVFRCDKSKVNFKYLFYFIQSDAYQKQIENSWTFGTQQNIGMRTLEKLKICFPPLSEQKSIADFLDKKCSAIDRVIEAESRIIEKLKEYRQSLITETVSHGLNPHAPMKASGIPWIGRIPRHWTVEKLKKLFSFGKGLNITKENLTETGIPVISYGQIHSKKNTGTHITDDLIKFVPEVYLENNLQSLVNKGDFIFADTSEDIEGAGNCVFIDKSMQLFAGYHSVILRNIDSDFMLGRYLSYLFCTGQWRSQIRSRVYGIKVYSITQKILKELTVIIPPLYEQKSIADFLDRKCSAIDSTISKKQQIIEKMTEYKKSLIYECVTGKISI